MVPSPGLCSGEGLGRVLSNWNTQQCDAITLLSNEKTL